MSNLRPDYDSPALQVATDANYAIEGDDWDGSATKIAPMLAYLKQGVGARPNKRVGAQFRNWLDNQFARVLSAVITNLAGFGTAMMKNWPYSSQQPADTSSAYPRWDAANERWIICADHGTYSQLYESHDGAKTWNPLGPTVNIGTGASAKSMYVAPNGDVMLLSDSGSVAYYTAGPGLWAVSVSYGSTSVPTELMLFAGVFVAFGSKSAGSLAALYTSPDHVTWTDRSAQIPGGASSVPTWVAACNSTIAVAIARASGNGTVMTSADGLTWTSHSLGGLIVAGQTVTGIVWSPADSAFFATVKGASSVLKSVDGVNWTATAAPTPDAQSITVIGGTLVILNDNTSAKAWFSNDGGVTWKMARFGGFGGANTSIRNTVVAGADQVIASNGKYYAASIAMTP